MAHVEECLYMAVWVYTFASSYEFLLCAVGDVTPPSESMKEFVLEAALFCKKAQCETRMTEEKKQKLAT